MRAYTGAVLGGSAMKITLIVDLHVDASPRGNYRGPSDARVLDLP